MVCQVKKKKEKKESIEEAFKIKPLFKIWKATSWGKIPVLTYQGLVAYRDKHDVPGGFIASVLCNDLSSAFSFADLDNAASMGSIIGWTRANLPGDIWGSPDKVIEHLKKKD